MTTTCECGQPVDGSYLCRRCTTTLTRDLASVPDLEAELDLVLGRMTAYAEHHGGRSAETPLPVDMRASEAAWVLRNTLTTWARVLHDERGVPLPTPRHERHSGATDAPPWGERTSANAPGPQIATQRCAHTDLDNTSCHHCRSKT